MSNILPRILASDIQPLSEMTKNPSQIFFLAANIDKL